jgi:DNA polymerase-3 subunit beta
MKFSTTSGELQKALSTIFGVVPTRTTNPMHENILFELSDSGLRLSATDSEISMSVRLSVKADQQGSIAVPARRLVETVRALPDVDLTLIVNPDDMKVTMKTSSGSYTLAGQDSKDFPQIPEKLSGKKVVFNSETLRHLITQTIFCISQDELRMAMTGVLFQFQDEELTAVATDGHRLVRIRQRDLGKTDLKQDVIVPAKTLAILARMTGNESCTITLDGKQIQFATESMTLMSRLLDETYPSYESVIPLDNDKKLTVNREETLSVIRRVSLYSSLTTHQIRFSIKKNQLTITAVDVDFGGEANETIDCEYDGPELEIGFNSKYLIDVFSHLNAEKALFKLSNAVRAAIIMPSEVSEETLLMLVMPMRLNY